MRVFKSISIFMVFFLLTTQIKAQNNYELPIRINKLGDRILFLKTGETTASSNIYAISTEEGMLMIDTGSLKSIAYKAREAVSRSRSNAYGPIRNC